MKNGVQKLGMFIAILIIYGSCTKAFTENMITLFLQPYPSLEEPKPMDEKYSDALQQPGYIHAKMLEHRFTKHGSEGIFGVYQGYITLSNRKGEILFPRKQQSSTINLLITPEIIPAFMVAPATIHHWELNPNISKDPEMQAMYSITLDHDPSTEAYFYDVKSIPLPADNVIDFTTVILLAPANMIYVPEGITMANYSANLILPPLYVKPGIQFTNNALYTLKIKQYFERINKTYKQYNASNQSTIFTIAMVLDNA
jgi:hypothetical protein